MASRIGIVTWQGKFNYGNRLQNYATCQIYQELECEPINLILQCDGPIIKIKTCIKTLIGKQEQSRESAMNPERLDAFDSFNRNLSFQVIHSLRDRQLEQFDFFSVGSDTIWNLSDKPFFDEWRYLLFCEPSKRIALAPSFGSDVMSKTQMKHLSRYVKDYPCLSTREDSGVELIRQASGRNAVALCDPTLVLEAADWRRVADDRLTPDYPYVFAYLLGERSAEVDAALDYALCNAASSIVMLSDKDGDGELPAGPAEFISLVENASHVITDSFHGAVFAALFERPLTVVHRIEGGVPNDRLFTRLDNLTHKLGLENRVMGSKAFDFNRAGDYDYVHQAIEGERFNFLSYLEACLNA